MKLKLWVVRSNGSIALHEEQAYPDEGLDISLPRAIRNVSHTFGSGSFSPIVCITTRPPDTALLEHLGMKPAGDR